MKTKNKIIIIASCTAVLVCVYFGYDYNDVKNENASYRSQIANLNTRIATLQNDKQELIDKYEPKPEIKSTHKAKSNVIKKGSRIKSVDTPVCTANKIAMDTFLKARDANDNGTIFSLTLNGLAFMLPTKTEMLVRDVISVNGYGVIVAVVQSGQHFGTTCYTYKPRASKVHKYFTVQ